MPPYDYDNLIAAARSGNRQAQLILQSLEAQRRVDAFKSGYKKDDAPYIDTNINIDDAAIYGDLGDIDTGTTADIYKSLYNKDNKTGGMEGALAFMNGATGIINTTREMSRIADTSQQRNMINDIGNAGSSKYGNINQAMSDMSRIDSMQPDLSLDTISGKSDMELAGGVLSNAYTGFTTGMQMGGIYGGLFGAAVGIGAGAKGVLDNKHDSAAEQSTDLAKLANARSRATINANAGIEDLQDNEHRSKIYNIGAKGGKMERNRFPIKREKVKGGTKIRIKR